MRSHSSISFALTLMLGIAASPASAQVCATPGLQGPIAALSGVVNSYYPGTGALVAATRSIPVGAIDLSAGGSSAAIGTGDLLIVMQMQGAEFNSSNSNCYGDGVGTAGCATRETTAANYSGGNTTGNYLAGNWEYCTAAGPVSGGAVPVSCAGAGGNLVNTYSSAVAGVTAGAYRYQVIRVPQYSAATLTAPVAAAAWNGATGGVVALQVAGALNMNTQSIDASRRGFRGGGVTFFTPFGPPVIDPTNGTSFYRAVAGVIVAPGPGGEREGNFKGEGSAGTPRLVYNGTAQVDTGTDGYPGGSRGRGAPGNAGGGGNNQNAGGGGGGNGGLGGSGGGGWNDVSRPTTFRDAGGFGGDGATRVGNNLALSIDRAIMGGGGGAGHVDGGGTNCQLGGWGGNGGGIVIVKAGQFSGSGSLLADGNNGFRPNTAGACTDAAGGAGAGGTVYVSADSGSLASLTINARGGNGLNSSFAEHGPGGGGGGGVVRYTGPAGVPAITVSGGSNGLDANGAPQGSFPATPQAWFSTPGANSLIASAATPSAQTTPPSTVCFPSLTVTKSTSTPTIPSATGAIADYLITVSNSAGGAAVSAAIVDNALPPGWEVQTVNSVVFAPSLSSTAVGGFVEGAVAGQPALPGAPGGPADLQPLAAAPSSTSAPFFRRLTVPGNGNATVGFSVAVSDATAVGTYHNSAGVQYLDPTRTVADTVIAPDLNNLANRCSTVAADLTGCSSADNSVAATTNSTYAAGGVVPGANYSGLGAGPTAEDVTLLADIAVSKSALPAAFTVGSSGQQYSLVGRNNGRAIANRIFANHQASDQLATALAAPSLEISDTLPTGITVTSVSSSNAGVWTCTPSMAGTLLTCSSSAAVYPLAAASDFVTITADLAISSAACPGPQVNTAQITVPTVGDAIPLNNAGSVSTAIGCSSDLRAEKDNGGTTLVSGATTDYTLTFSNLGPAAAHGAVVTDSPSAGLSSCSVTGCASAGGGSCPAPGQWPDLFAAGVALPLFPTASSVTFTVSCTVTATGL